MILLQNTICTAGEAWVQLVVIKGFLAVPLERTCCPTLFFSRGYRMIKTLI